MFAVSSQHQGKGLGKKLLEALISESKQRRMNVALQGVEGNVKLAAHSVNVTDGLTEVTPSDTPAHRSGAVLQEVWIYRGDPSSLARGGGRRCESAFSAGRQSYMVGYLWSVRSLG